MAKRPIFNKWVKRGSRQVNINNQNSAGVFESRLYVNNGQTATLTRATHKTLAGAERWSKRTLGIGKG